MAVRVIGSVYSAPPLETQYNTVTGIVGEIGFVSKVTAPSVLQFDEISEFPYPGSEGCLYVLREPVNQIYRWSDKTE